MLVPPTSETGASPDQQVIAAWARHYCCHAHCMQSVPCIFHIDDGTTASDVHPHTGHQRRTTSTTQSRHRISASLRVLQQSCRIKGCYEEGHLF